LSIVAGLYPGRPVTAGPAKPKCRQIQFVDKHIHDPNQVILGDIVIQAIGKQQPFPPVLPLGNSASRSCGEKGGPSNPPRQPTPALRLILALVPAAGACSPTSATDRARRSEGHGVGLGLTTRSPFPSKASFCSQHRLLFSLFYQVEIRSRRPMRCTRATRPKSQRGFRT
jgi:hypothetical protein